jgi:dipeptidyl-peptidase 4
LLRLHGVGLHVVRADSSIARVEQFIGNSVAISPQPFQGHHELRVTGRWVPLAGATTIPAGTVVVPCGQPLGIVAMYLLDPRSDDGLVTWNIGDRELGAGRPYPVTRVLARATQ